MAGLAPHNTIEHLTFLEDNINHILKCASSCNTDLRIRGHDTETIGLRIATLTQHPTDSLGHLDHIHVTHEDNTIKLTYVDTFGQNRAVKTHKLFARIFAPCIQRLEEYLTRNLLTVDNCTGLGCDIEVRITALRQLLCKICLKNSSQLLGSLGANNTFLMPISSIAVMILSDSARSDVLAVNLIHVNHMHLRGQDVTTINQLRCRNSTNHITINLTVIHAGFVDSDRRFASGSEKEAAICILTEILSGREKVTLDAVMCLVKVNRIDINLCIHDTERELYVVKIRQCVRVI